MALKVNVFFPDYNLGNANVLKAMAEGIPGASLVPDTWYVGCDVAVIFGLVKRSFAPSFRKAEIIAAHGRKPLLVVERGYVHRDRYWSAGWGGINGRADFRNMSVPSDRWNALGVELKSWRHIDGPVLVCGQVPWDVSVQDSDHIKWVRSTVSAITGMGKPALFRPHPEAVKRGVDYDPGCETSRDSLEADLARAAAVVTFNSNAGVDAVIAGVPTVTMDRGSMAWDTTGHGLDNLGRIPTPDRAEWANRIAYAQWTLDEMTSGLAWQHIGAGF